MISQSIMAARIDQHAGAPQAGSPSSPTAAFAPQQQSFPPRSSSMRQMATPTTSPDTPTTRSPVSLDPPMGTTYSQFLRTWTDAHVAQWLTDIRCGHQASTFRVNDIRGDILLELDMNTLKEMGIASLGDRLRIMNALKALRLKCSSRAILSPVSDTNRSPAVHTRTPSTTDSTSSPTSKPAARRLEAGRPAPLQIPRETPSNLPRVDRTGDSARVRPLPFPTPTTATPQSYSSNGPGASSSTPQDRNPISTPVSQSATSERSRLPPAAVQPLQPVVRNPTPGRSANRNPVNNHSGYRTPTQAEVSVYNNAPLPPAPGPPPPYGLPVDPRPGNLGGARTPVRANSPLNGTPVRERNTNLSPDQATAHARNTSLDKLNGVAGPSKVPPPRGPVHPYASASGQLPVPANHGINLSPIMEGFASQPGAGRTPSPPNGGNAAYTAGRAPIRSNTGAQASGPSLDELRRKVLKFSMFEQNQTRTIDVSNASGGFDVLEKALKKFGVARQYDTQDFQTTAEGGLVLDGWGAFLDWPDNPPASSPLNEEDLLNICHAPPNSSVKERGLALRRVPRSRRSKYDGLGVSRQSPTSLRFTANPSDDFSVNQLGVVSQATKNMRRASSISILSGLGVQDPERILEPPSPTQPEAPPDTPTFVQPPTPEAPAVPPKATPPGTLRTFPGQRPPSELVTNYLGAYFPGADKKVIERARRMSMLKPFGNRDSIASFATGGRPNPRFSRFSMSTQGSGGIRANSPSRGSTISGISTVSNDSAPRVSLSTDDGRSVELQPAYNLPAVSQEGESLAAELQAGLERRSESRQSMYSQYRTKREKDRSDAASLLTVDEITAEVESRRTSTLVDTTEGAEGWTKVSAGGETEETLTPSDETETDEDDEEEDWSEGSRWVKGALIGSGSFGQVYLGMDAGSGILMAVKQVELPTENTPNAERKKAMLTALEHEIALLQELRHQHIVQYLHSAMDEEYLNIFLEYVPGGSITALLRNYGAFEETLVKTFLRQILRGLEYLHAKDIIHRDIKGANILVDNKGTVKISDFGISKKGGAALAGGGGGRGNRPSLQGSVFWMAPEVVKQTAHSPKADIWSVGCLVVEMFTGEHPWAQLTQMQAIFKIGSSAKPEIPADISPEAQEFLALTFDLDYEKRPSATESLQHPWLALLSKKGGSKLKPPPVDA